MVNWTSATKVGVIAAEEPLATRVFARHRIDYCCGGGVALEVACSRRGLATESVLQELIAEADAKSPYTPRWQKAPLTSLIDYILLTHHQPLKEELPRLQAMANKVSEVHRERDFERLAAIASAVTEIQAELLSHMHKEEMVLFPMIRRGEGHGASGPIAVMLAEHDAAGAILQRLRTLTEDYTPPVDACTTWKALYRGLQALEEGLHDHIHLENNILFPRALGRAIATA